MLIDLSEYSSISEFRTADHMVVSEPYAEKNETGSVVVLLYLSLAPRAL